MGVLNFLSLISSFPQDPQLSAYAVSVDRIEQLTRLDFFSDLPASFEMGIKEGIKGTQGFRKLRTPIISDAAKSAIQSMTKYSFFRRW